MSEENESGEGTGIADLRKQYEAMKKELAAQSEELTRYRTAERQKTVAEALKAKGLPEAAAKFYTGDDVSEASVSKWAEENKDVFAVQQSNTPPTPTTPQVDPAIQQAQRVSDAAHGAESTFANTPAGQPQVVGDPAEMLRLMQTLPYEELQKRGWMPATEGTMFHNPSRR